MKHIDLKVSARHGQTARMPAGLRALIDNPRALDHVGTLDMDTVYKLPGGSVDQGAAERRDSSSAATTAPARSTLDPAEDDDQAFYGFCVDSDECRADARALRGSTEAIDVLSRVALTPAEELGGDVFPTTETNA